MKLVPDSRHLSDADLFDLVSGTGGTPPAHLTSCERCSRRRDAWREALQGTPGAGEPAVPAWLAARTMARVREAAAQSGRRGVVRIAALAATAAAVVLAIGLARRRGAPAPSTGPALAASGTASGLSPQDRADDALLRDISRDVEGNDEAVWKDFAPLPKLEERS